MPQLSDIAKKKKRFTKINYRPWDISGAGSSPPNHTDGNMVVEHQEALAQPQTIVPISKDVQETLAAAKAEIALDNDIDNKQATNQITTEKHIENKQITIKKHSDNIQITDRKQKANLLDNDIDNEYDIEFYVEAIRKLTGIQEKMFYYIVELCTTRGGSDTGHLLTTDLAKVAHCTVGSAKTSLERLIQKKLIIRKQGKSSRGGHLFLYVAREAQAATAQAKKYLRNINTDSLVSDNVIANNLDNIVFSNSSSNNYINTTTALPQEWQEIDYSALIHIGFSNTQLTQLYSKQLNIPPIIQESVNHFAFGLEYNPKFKTYTDPLNVLMGVLRKGGAWYEKNYVSPKEKALEELLKFKKEEAERIQAMEKDILDEEYKIWASKLTKDEKNKITESIPKNKSLPKGVIARATEGYLLQYFKENIYGKN
jgi:hypothetical protein